MLAIADTELRAALSRIVFAGGVSRRRLFLEELAKANFDRLRAFIVGLPLYRVGYSVKTNPRPELLQEALRCGFYAECISNGEVQASLRAGFAPERVIYNGPVAATTLAVQPKYVFADSIEAYAADCAAPATTIAGIRIRPPGISSRFGVPSGRLHELLQVMRESGRRETAVSFQVRSEDYGENTFRGIAAAVLEIASQIESRTGMHVVGFDTGGGRSAIEFDASAAAGDYDFIHDAVCARLPHVREIIIEPGQELDFSLEAMVAPILEVRSGHPAEVVVDAGLPDFPAIAKSPHRLFLLRDGVVAPLPRGRDRVLGRTCLEDDVIGSVSLPSAVRCGDAIVVADVGAYDASMRYAFAQGRESGNTAF